MTKDLSEIFMQKKSSTKSIEHWGGHFIHKCCSFKRACESILVGPALCYLLPQ